MLAAYHNFEHRKSYAIISTFVLCLAWTGLAHGQDVDASLHRLRHETTDRSDWGEAMALRVVQDEGIEPLIEALRTDEEPAVRGAAAEALGLVGDEQGVETLRAIQPLIEVMQQDGATSVRRAAADALGDIGDKRAIPALTEALKQDLAQVRQAAAAALGRIDDEQAIPALVSTLQRDDGPKVRAAAAEALGLIGEEQAVEPLIEAMQQDESPKVRSAAAAALESVNSHRDTYGDASTAPASSIAIFGSTRDARRADSQADTKATISGLRARSPASRAIFLAMIFVLMILLARHYRVLRGTE